MGSERVLMGISATHKWIRQFTKPISMVKLALEGMGTERDHSWETAMLDLAGSLSLDRLTRTELQLLPVLATALAQILPHHPSTTVALGAKRRAATEALLAQSAARTAAQALARSHLSVVPLKGIALDGLYADFGWRRPMGDADLMVVDSPSWEKLTAILKQAGFTAGPISVHARNFDLPDGRRVDIHRYVSTPNAFPKALSQVLPLLYSPDPNDPYSKQLPLEFHMAHAIEHGMRWNPIPPARSISDIAVIQLTAPDLNWHIVHQLLLSWAADQNGSALIDVLVAAGILPTHAKQAREQTKDLVDIWLQAMMTADPRRSWIRQFAAYHALVPLRLRMNDKQFMYQGYLRSVWSLDPKESLLEAARSRLRMRLHHGRNLPQYMHD
jgi:DNA-binding transcriptional MocR family regulator